jgi:hypothetical protein
MEASLFYFSSASKELLLSLIIGLLVFSASRTSAPFRFLPPQGMQSPVPSWQSSRPSGSTAAFSRRFIQNSDGCQPGYSDCIVETINLFHNSYRLSYITVLLPDDQSLSEVPLAYYCESEQLL